MLTCKWRCGTSVSHLRKDKSKTVNVTSLISRFPTINFWSYVTRRAADLPPPYLNQTQTELAFLAATDEGTASGSLCTPAQRSASGEPEISDFERSLACN